MKEVRMKHLQSMEFSPDFLDLSLDEMLFNLKLFIKEAKSFSPKTSLQDIYELNVNEGYNHIVICYGNNATRSYIDVCRTSVCIPMFRIHGDFEDVQLKKLRIYAEVWFHILQIQDKNMRTFKGTDIK